MAVYLRGNFTPCEAKRNASLFCVVCVRLGRPGISGDSPRGVSPHDISPHDASPLDVSPRLVAQHGTSHMASRHRGHLPTLDASQHGILAPGLSPSDILQREVQPHWALYHGTNPACDQRLLSDCLKPDRALASAPHGIQRTRRRIAPDRLHPFPADGDDEFGERNSAGTSRETQTPWK